MGIEAFVANSGPKTVELCIKYVLATFGKKAGKCEEAASAPARGTE